jgi:hypothetical protein
MLGKILITFLVILAAIIVLRNRNQATAQEKTNVRASERNKTNNAKAGPGADSLQTSDFRLAAYMFLTLMFGAAIILYYLRWQDDHTIITVQLYRDEGSAAVTYEVYKYQLDSPASRTFTTIDGNYITVADNERMEVAGLD